MRPDKYFPNYCQHFTPHDWDNFSDNSWELGKFLKLGTVLWDIFRITVSVRIAYSMSIDVDVVIGVPTFDAPVLKSDTEQFSEITGNVTK